jgi:hypothetical protein
MIMTKRDIIKFLERKQNEKVSAVRAEYVTACRQEEQRVYDELGLPALAGNIHAHIQEASKLWEDWQKRHEGYDGLKIVFSHYSLMGRVFRAADTSDGTYTSLLDENISYSSKTLDSMRKQCTLEQERVMATFTTVISTVQQMKFIKEAAAYLKELGFDLTELENPAPQDQTALMVPIDTSYLFVKAA